MKSNGNPSQSPQSESLEVLNSFGKESMEELLASGSAPMWMVSSQRCGMLEEEQSPPPNQLSQKNEHPRQMEMASQSFSLIPNDVASEDVSTSDEQEASMTMGPLGDSTTGIGSSYGSSEDDTSMLVANSILKKMRSVSGGETETSPKGGNRPRGVMSAPRFSLASYSMPSLLSIDENYDSAFMVNGSVSSFVEFGNESTVSFLDNSSRTNSCLDTSSRTSSSHARASGAPSFSSMPSLRSIEDNEDSQLLIYDASRSTFGNSSSTESAFNSSPQNSRMMLPIIVDSNKQGFGGIKVSYEGQRFAAESVTKDIISPPSISQHLHIKNLEKRHLRWDAATSSIPRGPPTAGYLRPSLYRPTATTSLTASLKNDPTSLDARNSDLDAKATIPGRPEGDSNAVADGIDRILPLRSGSCDTRPAMARRRSSVTVDTLNSFSSQEETDT